jgi:hypothetical protein
MQSEPIEYSDFLYIVDCYDIFLILVYHTAKVTIYDVPRSDADIDAALRLDQGDGSRVLFA